METREAEAGGGVGKVGERGGGQRDGVRQGREGRGEGGEEGLRKDKSNGTLIGLCDIKLLALSDFFVFILILGIYKRGNHVGVKKAKK